MSDEVPNWLIIELNDLIRANTHNVYLDNHTKLIRIQLLEHILKFINDESYRAMINELRKGDPHLDEGEL